MISRLISLFISPYYKILNFFRNNYSITDIEIKTILVTEYHRIGDVLIISPVLKSLKRKFPKAQLILICNREVGQLASHLNLADEVYTLNVPWTNWSWSIFWWWDIRSKAKSFSSKNIDHISKWVDSPKIFEIKYKDESKEIVEKLINDYSNLN